MKKVLILGISGTFGRECAIALKNAGYTISGFGRSRDTLPASLTDITFHNGDINNDTQLRSAMAGVDAIVYGINPANYRWENTAVPLLEKVSRLASEQKQTIVFPGNVYNFNPDHGPDYDEQAPHQPITRLGEIRSEMENVLRRASQKGAKVIILRMGDFIAENGKSTWFAQMVKKTAKGYDVFAPGSTDQMHTWAYVPDAATQLSVLLAASDSMPAFNTFHFEGYRVSIEDIANSIREITGQTVKVKRFPWFAIKLMAPFSPLFRGLLSMRYLWEREINLVDKRSSQYLETKLRPTSLKNALINSKILTTGTTNVSKNSSYAMITK